MNPLILMTWIIVAAFVFAKVEIQIEGGQGWAAGLPTWRIEKHPLLDLFWGGRPMTGYHAWVFLFMALVFHFPLIVSGGGTLLMEARIVGSLALFWIIEDFLWFVLNPAYGLARFDRAFIPWHKHWWGPVPADYITMGGVGAVLIVVSFLGSP